MTAGNNIQFRRTPEIDAVLPELQKKTALDQSGVIRLAIMEMAERRGVSLDAVDGRKGELKTKRVKKRKGP